MKKFISLFLIVIMVLSVGLLTACGPNNSDNGDPEPTGELTFDENGNVVFDNIELKLETVVVGDDKPALASLIAKFNAQYRDRISVYTTYVAQDVYESTVENQVTHNSNAPDIIMSHVKSHKSFADNKIIQSLDNAMQKSNIRINVAQDYAEGLASYSSCGYTGKTYSVPIDMQTMAVYYNKDLLQSTCMDFPTNRTELLNVCAEIKRINNNITYPIACASTGEFFGWYVFPTALLQNSASFYNASDYRANWKDGGANETAFTDGIESLRELFYTYGYAQYGSSTALTDFLQGKSLFYFDLSWGTSSLISAFATQNSLTEEQAKAKIGVGSLSGWFAKTESSNSNLIYGDSHFFAMTKTVTDIVKQAAVCEFIRWFTSQVDVGKTWASAGHLSASKTVSASQSYLNDSFINNFIKPIYGDINNFRSVGITPYYKDLQAQLTALYVNTVGNPNSNIATSIKEYQDALNGIIEFAEM